MSSDVRELYQEIIIDHNRNPRNHYIMEEASAEAHGFNPLCGDQLTVYVKLQDNRVQEVSFVGCGCAISQASASLMTEIMWGKPVEEAFQLFQHFHAMVTEQVMPNEVMLDKLTVLAGVKAYPARVKCATLAWHTFEAALNKQAETVSTE